MKNTLLATFLFSAALFLSSCHKSDTTVCSPDGNITFSVKLKEGNPVYSVTKDGFAVLSESALGFTLKGEDRPMALCEVSLLGTDSCDQTWEQVWGEERFVRNNYNEMTVRMSETGENARCVDLIVRVFDDGFGFRYSFPEQDHLGNFAIAEENTEFRFTQDHEAWWLQRSIPYYEA